MNVLTDDSIDFLAFLAEQESQFIRPASDWLTATLARMRGEGGSGGDLLPWSKTHNKVALRPGEVSIWGGFNGHGKSQMIGQVAAWGLKQKRWLIASMEMLPAATMERMVHQVSGTHDPAEEYIERFAKWTDGRLWIYDQTDTVKSDRILGMVHYAAKELGIQHIVIDSLMKCGFRGSKDQVSLDQVAFVDRLCWAAKSLNVHIHLVHHMRKGEGNKGEFNRPGKHDFRGAGEIVDMVDNAFIVHRNKRKEEKARTEAVDDNEPDSTLEVVKQRNGEWEGLFKFWFHPGSKQYTPDNMRKPLPFK